MTAPAAAVICAYNDAEYIGDVVRASVAQDLPEKEIVVVDDCSTDATPEVLRAIDGIRVLRNEKNLGLGASLTRGVRSTDAPVVFSLHSDCLPRDTSWMRKMVDPFVDPAVGAVVSRRAYAGRQALTLGSRLFDVVCPQELNPRASGESNIDFFRGKADAYRRDLVERLGGWDPAFFTAGEDTDFSIRMRAAGYRIVLHSEATVEYLFSSRQRTIGGGLRKALLYGSTAALLYRRHRYDGLQTRSYLWCLLSLLVLALPLTACLALSAILLATSFNRMFQVHSLRRRLPLGLLWSLFALAGLGAAAAIHRPPAEFAALGLPAASLFFVAYISLKNSVSAIRRGENALLLPLLFSYAVAWHLLSGVGYAIGFAKLSAVRK